VHESTDVESSLAALRRLTGVDAGAA
jgi:hypothetical protein